MENTTTEKTYDGAKKEPQLLSVLYWNVKLSNKNGSNIQKVLQSMAEEFKPHLLFLTDFMGIENENRKVRVESLLPIGYESYKGESDLSIFYGKKKRPIVLFYQKDLNTIPKTLDSGENYTIFQLTQPPEEAIILIPVHFKSQLDTNKRDRMRIIEREVQELITQIRKSESPERIFLFGDFNVNPWDMDMIDSYLFSSISDRDAQMNGDSEGLKTMAGKGYPVLYNPTWALLGDYVAGTESQRQPSASYFFPTNQLCHWANMYDQLLMPFKARRYFHFSSFRYLDKIGETNLWNYQTWGNAKGAFNPDYSDHLPLFFQIKLNP